MKLYYKYVYCKNLTGVITFRGSIRNIIKKNKHLSVYYYRLSYIHCTNIESVLYSRGICSIKCVFQLSIKPRLILPLVSAATPKWSQGPGPFPPGTYKMLNFFSIVYFLLIDCCKCSFLISVTVKIGSVFLILNPIIGFYTKILHTFFILR